MKATGNEIFFCSVALLLGGFSVWCIGHAYWTNADAGGPSYGAGLESGISAIAGVVVAGLGSVLAFGAKKNKDLVLVRSWIAARWLNYGVFIPGSLFLMLQLLKGCQKGLI